MERRYKKMQGQSGNVLFLILIAVALFAALAYAVTQSTRSGSGDTRKEKANLCVSQINSMLVGLDTTVLRIKSKGYADYQIDTASIQPRSKFGNAINNVTNTACNSVDCRVFSDKGGNFSLPAIDKAACGAPASDAYYDGAPAAGSVEFLALKIKDIGSATNNSLAVRVFRVNREVCDLFNQQHGIASNWHSATGYANGTETNFAGPMTEFPVLGGGATAWENYQGANGAIAGKTSFCYRADPGHLAYAIIHLLSIR